MSRSTWYESLGSKIQSVIERTSNNSLYSRPEKYFEFTLVYIEHLPPLFDATLRAILVLSNKEKHNVCILLVQPEQVDHRNKKISGSSFRLSRYARV